VKTLLTFNQFITEAIVQDDFKKVCITRRKVLNDSFITGPDYHTSEYWLIITKDMDESEVPGNLPVLNYDRGTLEKFIDEGVIREEQIYNKIDARLRISSKAEFYKEHADSGFIVPTVLDPRDLKDLKFPIVAKPDNEHSGLGIQVFDNQEDIDNADLSQFTSFSEKLDIKEEHRYFVWRGEVIQWTQRIPMDKETADIAKKDPGAETNFSYVLMDISKIKDSHLKAIRYFSDAHRDLDFYAVDLAENNDEGIFVFEMNSEPGALFGVMSIIYQKIFEDYYGKYLSQETIKQLEKFRQDDIKQNTKQNPNWKVSK
jgi:hypothetical protein